MTPVLSLIGISLLLPLSSFGGTYHCPSWSRSVPLQDSDCIRYTNFQLGGNSYTALTKNKDGSIRVHAPTFTDLLVTGVKQGAPSSFIHSFPFQHPVELQWKSFSVENFEEHYNYRNQLCRKLGYADASYFSSGTPYYQEINRYLENYQSYLPVTTINFGEIFGLSEKKWFISHQLSLRNNQWPTSRSIFSSIDCVEEKENIFPVTSEEKTEGGIKYFDNLKMNFANQSYRIFLDYYPNDKLTKTMLLSYCRDNGYENYYFLSRKSTEMEDYVAVDSAVVMVNGVRHMDINRAFFSGKTSYIHQVMCFEEEIMPMNTMSATSIRFAEGKVTIGNPMIYLNGHKFLFNYSSRNHVCEKFGLKPTHSLPTNCDFQGDGPCDFYTRPSRPRALVLDRKTGEFEGLMPTRQHLKVKSCDVPEELIPQTRPLRIYLPREPEENVSKLFQKLNIELIVKQIVLM